MLLPHYRALYKERGLLTANEKDIKNKEEIKTLLDAAWEPKSVVVIHCQGHQKEDTPRPGIGETAWQIRPLNKQPRAWA